MREVRWQHARLSVDKGLEVVDDLEVLALQAVEVLLDLELDDAERVVLFPVAATHETCAGDAQHAGMWAGGRACGRGAHRLRPSRFAMYGVTLLPVSPVMTFLTSSSFSGAATCIPTLLRARREPSLAVLWSGSRRPTPTIAGTCASISRPASMKRGRRCGEGRRAAVGQKVPVKGEGETADCGQLSRFSWLNMRYCE